MVESVVNSRVAFLVFATFLLQTLVVVCDDEHGSHAVSHDSESFKESLDDNKNFVMFYAPWCGHCKNLAPTWDELGKLYNKEGNTNIIVGKVDCTVHTDLCAEQEIIGFPTLKLFLAPTTVKRYAGKRDLESLRNYVDGHLTAIDPEHETEEGDETKPEVPKSKEALVILTDESFKETVSDGLFFIKFYAPWCGHCQRLAPVWDDLAESYKHTESVSIAKVDCTLHGETCKEFGIRGYPTLLWFKDGEKVSQYQGARTHEALKTFVAEEVAKAGEQQEEEEEEWHDEHTHGEEEEDEDEDSKDEVKELTVDNVNSFLSKRLVFIKFFAPWCGHCKRLAPTWDDLAREVEDLPVSIAKVDCTQHKQVCDQNQVKGYPTLRIFNNGEKLEDYRGSRSLEDLHEFVKKHINKVHDEL